MVDLAGTDAAELYMSDHDREILEELGPEALDRFNDTAVSRMMGELESREENREVFAGDEQFGVLVLRGDDPTSDLARSIEYPTFKKRFNNTYEEMEAGYGPYDDRSVFMLVVDKISRKPAGALRLVLPPQEEDDPQQISLEHVTNEAGDPRLHWNVNFLDAINNDLAQRTDLPEEYRRTSVEQITDVGTVAVAPGYGGGRKPTPEEEAQSGLVSSALYRAAALYTLNSGGRDWVTIIDTNPLVVIQAVFDNPLEHVTGLEKKSYWGSKSSIPMYMNVEAFFLREKATNQGVYEFLRDATGAVDIHDFFTFPGELDPPEGY